MTASALRATDFPRVETRHYRPFDRGCRLERLTEAQLEELSDIDGLLARAVTVKDSRGTTAGIADTAAGKVFVKRYNAYNFKRRFRQLFDVPRPLTTLKATSLLENLLPVPELLVALVEKNGQLTRRHAIVTAAYPAPLTAAEQLPAISAPEAFRAFAGKLAEMVNAMHASGVFHGDLKLHNILLRVESGEFTVGTFDFDGAEFFPSPVAGSKRHRDWARAISSYLRLCRAAGIAADEKLVIETFAGAAGNLDRRELADQLAAFARKQRKGG